MLGHWLSHTATSVSANTNPTTLTGVTNFPTYTDVFGAGARVVTYEMDDGAGHFEAGIGTVTALSLSRDIPTATFDVGATPKYVNTGTTRLATFSATVNVRCAPLISDAYPSAKILWDGLGDGVPSAGDPQSGGYTSGATPGAVGFIVCRPFIWRGARPITKAQMYCTSGLATAKMLVGLYEPTTHNSAALRLDLSNGGAGFTGATTGSKPLVSPTNFAETFLPIGEYIVAFLQLTAVSSWAGFNKQTGASAVLGVVNGLPIGYAVSGSAQTSLPAILGSGGTAITSSGDIYSSNVPFALNLGW